MKYVAGSLTVALLAVGVASAQEGGKTAKEATAEPITGQCHCGHVKYRAQGPIFDHNYCDCRGCQRATGTLKAPFVVVRKATFTVTAGEPARFRSKSKVKCDAHGVWCFCPKCGTQVFWLGDKGNKLDIFAGTLDDTKLFQPKK